MTYKLAIITCELKNLDKSVLYKKHNNKKRKERNEEYSIKENK